MAKGRTLEEVLRAYDGLFQDWRHIFEGHYKPVDLSGLFAVLAFFSEVLHALPQRWVQGVPADSPASTTASRLHRHRARRKERHSQDEKM